MFDMVDGCCLLEVRRKGHRSRTLGMDRRRYRLLMVWELSEGDV